MALFLRKFFLLVLATWSFSVQAQNHFPALSAQRAQKQNAQKKFDPKTLPSAELVKRAEEEVRSEGKKQSIATDAQVSGLLQLEDPRSSISDRSWKYIFSAKLQSFKASGSVEATATRFDVSSPTTVMPVLEFGLRTTTHPLFWGTSFEAGLVSQKQAAQFQSGFVADDARINSTIFAVGPLLGYAPANSAWTFSVQTLYQLLLVSQVSKNDLANYSRQSSAWLGRFEADYLLSKNTHSEWHLTALATQRLLENKLQITTPNNSLSMGARLIW
ncbi:MAG: hypothetical protein ACOYOK_12305 [Pseudobdellovibrionaceae bacterium]